jgi:hypothetical protein
LELGETLLLVGVERSSSKRPPFARWALRSKD